jgi:hypothetical protein
MEDSAIAIVIPLLLWDLVAGERGIRGTYSFPVNVPVTGSFPPAADPHASRR